MYTGVSKIQTSFNKLRRLILIIFDFFCFALIEFAFFFASAVFFPIVHYTQGHYIACSAILLLMVFVARFAAGVYFNVWRYTNTWVYFKTMVVDVCGAIAALLICRVSGIYQSFWFFLVVSALAELLMLCSRFVYRLIYKKRNHISECDEQKIPVAIVGAGQVGVYLANELLYGAQSKYSPIFFIDKDDSKVGSRVLGLKVYKNDESVRTQIENQGIKEIFIAVMNLTNDDAERIFEFYSKIPCKIKIYDTPVRDFQHSYDNQNQKRQIREFQIEDLLFRQPLTVNNQETKDFYSGKTILVTGGGGSIGSELCRQIAKCHPRKLIIFDIYENNAYEIQQELLRKYGDDIHLEVEIGSVRDRDRLDCVFQAYHPDIVFHAAAHKHVPLMEHSGCESIKNNVLGTYNAADMAEKYGVKKFILISTDKAVNPTNIMGASKRMCEMIVQCRVDSQVQFDAVRFGNVLGSNGSVIPLFRRQIAHGGPITITDKRIIRYFMTIPEASQLVMQAGAMAKKGELFVLDMGKPIRIYDLAVNMIRLSGFEPGKDIRIDEIGLRPGEKLYEELLIQSETLNKTENDMIFVEKDSPLPRQEVDAKIKILTDAVDACKKEIASMQIKQAFKAVVSTFRDPEEVNASADQSKEMNAVTG